MCGSLEPAEGIDVELYDMSSKKFGDYLCNSYEEEMEFWYYEPMGVGYVSPQLPYTEYCSWYDTDFFHNGWQESIGHPTTNQRFDSDVDVAGIRIAEYSRRLGDLKHLGPAIDVGCSNGAFVQRMLQQGLECVGVDVSPATIEEAKCRPLLSKNLYLHNFEQEPCNELKHQYYNLVLFHDVWEHLYYPGKALVNICKRTPPKFILIVDMPCLDSGLANGIAGWKHLWGHIHPYLYTIRGLVNVVSAVMQSVKVLHSYCPIPDKRVVIMECHKRPY